MATVKRIEAPPELAGARSCALSPDGRTVACRLDGERAGLYAFEVGGHPRPMRLDDPGRRHLSPAWSASGDLLFRIEGPDGSVKVGAAPAPGRGSPVEYSGSGLAVSHDGRVLAVADPAGGRLAVAVAQLGNSPFNEPLRAVAELHEADPGAPIDLQLTRDASYVVVIRLLSKDSPSLWSFPVEGGDGQELAPELPAPGFMSFGLSKSQLATLEIRRGVQPSSRVCVRPLAAGSLGALRLGPARDLLFVRQELSEQHLGFSPDGKKLAVLVASIPSLPGDPPAELALDLLPTGGGLPVRAVQMLELRGGAHFLDSGEVVVDGLDRVAVVTL